jgi:hypothetical protein
MADKVSANIFIYLMFLSQGPILESEGEEEKEGMTKMRKSRRHTLALNRKKSAEEDDITVNQMANLLTVLDRHQIQADFSDSPTIFLAESGTMCFNGIN